MGAAFRLLLMTCLLWCALGVAEPVQAHGPGNGVGNPQGKPSVLATDHAPAADDGATGDAAAAPGHHHHCPVASDPAAGPFARTGVAVRDAPVARGIAALASLTRAPPLPPPATA